MDFTFLENALIRGTFTRAPPHSKLAPKFLSSRARQKEITHYPGNILSRICFPQLQNGVEKTLISFIKFHSENMKMGWNIVFIFFMICIFSNVMVKPKIYIM